MRTRFLFYLILLFAGHTAAQPVYFQQEVNYRIEVSLDDRSHLLHANLSLDYVNHSPDTLHEIWFHLWPNAYRDRNTALAKQTLENGDKFMYFAKAKSLGYIDSLMFSAAGKPVSWERVAPNPDIAILRLNDPLLPGAAITIQTPFRVKIPDGRISRLGHIGQAYAITQWYPKPAVYDTEGWHPMPYLNQGEFYSEYGAFDVTIHLPRNYVVGATGELQTSAEIAFLDSLEKQPKTMQGGNLEFPSSDPEIKTIRYTQDSIHDFAWFADKRFQVSGSEVTLPNTGRRVKTRAMYTNAQAGLWQNATQYIDSAVYYYSSWVGDYPYSTCTAVDGTISAGGGMEYPMITIIGGVGDAYSLDIVIAHEVGHNWFYGILGSNEREFPWMDEGINSFYELRYSRQRYKPVDGRYQNELSMLGNIGQLAGTDKLDPLETFRLEYAFSACNHTDQIINGPSDEYTSLNYGTIVYRKTALAFNYLRDFLGTETFDKAMQSYYRQWSFRHPDPADLQQVFEVESGRDLDWFFSDLLNDTHKQDFKFGGIRKEADNIQFRIKEKSGLRSPLNVSLYAENNLVKTISVAPFSKDTLVKTSCMNCDRIVLDPEGASLDLNRRNNTWDSNRLLNRLSGTRFNILPALDEPSQRRIYMMPLLAWNEYDRWMPGLYLHNKSLPLKKAEFEISPLYSFSTKQVNGMAGFDYRVGFRQGPFSQIILANSFRKFTYERDTYLAPQGITEAANSYWRYSPSLRFMIRKAKARSPLTQELALQSIHLGEERISYRNTTEGLRGFVENTRADFYRLAWKFSNNRTLDPYRFSLQMETNKDVLKADICLNYHISYKEKRKGADIRLFAGYAIRNEADGRYGYFLSDRSAVFGSTDYAYDELYLGRSAGEGILFSQMAIRQGGFRAYTPLGAYKDWIISLNSTIDFPGRLPISFYFDIGTTEGLKQDLKNAFDISQQFSYGGGICLRLVKDVLEVYFPLFRSEEIKRYLDTNDKAYREQIRFVLDLSRLNPLGFRDGIRL